MKEQSTIDEARVQEIVAGRQAPPALRPARLAVINSVFLGILGYFGTVLFFPKPILESHEQLTTGWITVFLVVGFFGGVATNLLFKRRLGVAFLAVGVVVSTFFMIATVSSFIEYTVDNLEPWIMQLGWFIRTNGLVVGMLLGSTTFTLISGLSLFIATNADDPRTGVRGNQGQGTGKNVHLMVGASLALYGLLLLVYRYVTPLAALVGCFVACGVATFLTLHAFLVTAGRASFLPEGLTVYSRRKHRLIIANKQVDEKPGGATQVGTGDVIDNNMESDVFSPFNRFLSRAGTERIGFWWFAILSGLAAGGTFTIYTIIYPSATSNYLELVLIPLLVSLVYNSVSLTRQASDTMLATFGVKRWRMTGLFVARMLLPVALLLPATLLVYFFPYEVFIPAVLGGTALAGVGGVLVARAVHGKPRAILALRIISIAVLLANAFLLFNDAVLNAYSYNGPEPTYFPFTYIHGPSHFISMGFCSGFLLSTGAFRLMLEENRGGDSVQRASLVALVPLVLGAFPVFFSWGVLDSAFPGGRIEIWKGLSVPGDFTILYVACLVLLLLAMFLEIILAWYPAWLKKRGAGRQAASKQANPGTGDARKRQATGANGDRPTPVRGAGKGAKIKNAGWPGIQGSRAILLAVLVTSVLFIGGGIWLGTNFAKYRAKDVLYYKPNEHAMWLLNSSERVNPNAQVYLDPRNLVTNFTIHAAANEYEAFQVVWTSLGASLNDLFYQVSDFVDVANSSNVISSSVISVFHVKNIIDGTFPDRLDPLPRLEVDQYGEQIHDGKNHAFWVAIRVPYGTAPGYYSGKVDFLHDFNRELSHENFTISINFTIHVWNFTVPRMRHLRTNMGPQTDYLPYMDSFISHRINSYGVPITGTTSWDAFASSGGKYTAFFNQSNNEWTFNWTYWDNLTAYNLANGANGFYVGNPIQGIPRVPRMDDPDWTQAYRNFLQGVQAHLQAKNWLEYAYIYFIDEFQMFIPEGFTQDSYYDLVERFLSLINESAPLVKIMTTTPPRSDGLSALREYIDIYCPIATDYNKTEWEQQMAKGKEFWMYFCVGPATPWPNSHLYNRLYETRVMLWQAYHYGIQGFLYWSSNAQYHGNYGFAYNSWGDGWFVHIDTAGNVRASPRWENYLDAQEDYEYLWLINRTVAWLRANSSVPASTLDGYELELQDIIASVVGDRDLHSQHPVDLYSARLRAGEILDNLSSYLDIVALAEEKWSPPVQD